MTVCLRTGRPGHGLLVVMPRTLTAASNPVHAVNSVPVGLCNRSKVPGMRETGCHVWAGLTKAGTGALGGRADVRGRQVPTASFGNKPGGMPWVPRDMHHHHASSRSNPERSRRVVVNSLGYPAAVAWPTTKRQSRIGVVAGLALSAFEPDEVEQVQGVGVPPGPVVVVDTDVGRAGLGDVSIDGDSGRDDVQDTGPWGCVLRRHPRDSRPFPVRKGAVLRIKLL